MTLSEFKAWFEGFTESMEGAPTEAQFAKIKNKVALIDGTPITYPIYVERWWPNHRPTDYWGWPSYVTSGGAISTLQAVGRNDGVGVANFEAYAPNSAYPDKGASVTVTFDSHAAMRDLGRAEALN
jgi:hypothetical protein